MLLSNNSIIVLFLTNIYVDKEGELRMPLRDFHSIELCQLCKAPSI